MFKYRTIWRTPLCHIAETEPRLVSLKFGYRRFKVMIPYVQYTRNLNSLIVTFSNKPASLKTRVYLNPLPNNMGFFVCMGTCEGIFGTRRKRMNFFVNMDKTIDMYWLTSFDSYGSVYPFSLSKWAELSKTPEKLLNIDWNCYQNTLYYFSSFLRAFKQ